MDDFKLKELNPYIFILVGVASILSALLKKAGKSVLKTTGKKAEEIIYALDRSSNVDAFNEPTTTLDKVTIRFVTANFEWITGEINQDFATFSTGQYKLGEKVEVYYDPQNPSSFFIDTKQSDITGKLLFLAVGLVFFAIGLYQLLSAQA